jgi:glycerol-3-phosphate acyltransferase PlsX
MGRSLMSKIGYWFAKQAFDALREKMDPRRVNGGVFLGLDGVVIKSHGGADALGYAGAIEIAHAMVRHGLLAKIRESLSYSQDGRATPVAGVEGSVSL